MCGIAGIIDARIDTRTAHSELSAVMRAMHHRGPDQSGTIHSGPAHLGHVRLSILDIQGGAQPMSNEKGTVWLVFNGEIYNFRQLRKDLQARGHKFHSTGDTEVIIHLYEELGGQVVEALDGMFAFAIWDARIGRLLLARDRFGQKPLYYHEGLHGICFASEMKALLRFSNVPGDIDNTSLADYMILNYVPAPATLVRGVNKLPPGHTLTWRDSHSAMSPYFHPGPSAHTPVPTSKVRAISMFWERFDRSVQKRLVADVPVGLFLSGGIDSTAIAVSMARSIGPKRVRAFTIGFSDPDFDESTYAGQVARKLGIPLQVKDVGPKEVQDVFPGLADIADEPVSDNSIIPTYMLCRFARQDITVALSGDGGDELFMGYPTLNADFANRLLEVLPLGLRTARLAMALVLRFMKTSFSNISKDFKLRRFARGLGLNTPARHGAYLGALTPGQAGALGLPADRAYKAIESLFPGDPSWSWAQRLSAFYLRTYLAEDVLVKVDRASMAASLEARAPFLDPEVVDFAFSLPLRMSFHPLKTKVFLRQALATRFKDPIVLKRPKKGFGLPVGRWFRGPLRPLLESELDYDTIKSQGLFDPDAVKNLIQEHVAGVFDHRMVLFSLLLLELWIKKNLV